MELTITLHLSAKDEPTSEAIPFTPANVVARTRDVLSDQFKHDEVSSWLIDRIELTEG